MKEILYDLKKVLNKIEKLDDPTASFDYRDRVGEVHYFIEESILEIEELIEQQGEDHT